jgi:hypothetical protein
MSSEIKSNTTDAQAPVSQTYQAPEVSVLSLTQVIGGSGTVQPDSFAPTGNVP